MSVCVLLASPVSHCWSGSADELVKCPVCRDLVEFQVINSHMDGPDCGQKSRSKANNSSSSVKTEWGKLFDGKSKKGQKKDDR